MKTTTPIALARAFRISFIFWMTSGDFARRTYNSTQSTQMRRVARHSSFGTHPSWLQLAASAAPR